MTFSSYCQHPLSYEKILFTLWFALQEEDIKLQTNFFTSSLHLPNHILGISCISIRVAWKKCPFLIENEKNMCLFSFRRCCPFCPTIWPVYATICLILQYVCANFQKCRGLQNLDGFTFANERDFMTKYVKKSGTKFWFCISCVISWCKISCTRKYCDMRKRG